MGPHLRIVEHALVDFHGRDRVARFNGTERVKPLFIRNVVVGRNPAVPLAQQPNEERPAVLDLVQADFQGFASLGVLLGHTPAQVHVDQVEVPRGAPLPQFREHLADQMIPFRVHVAEGRGDEHTNGFPNGGHGAASGRAVTPVMGTGGPSGGPPPASA